MNKEGGVDKEKERGNRKTEGDGRDHKGGKTV